MAEPKLQAKIEARVKVRNALSRDIQKLTEDLAKKFNELLKHDVETYELLVKPDSLYGDSPVGRAFTSQWLKHFMIKLDLDFVGYVLDGKVSIKDFTERMQEASAWCLRFAKDPEPPKSGIDLIL